MKTKSTLRRRRCSQNRGDGNKTLGGMSRNLRRCSQNSTATLLSQHCYLTWFKGLNFVMDICDHISEPNLVIDTSHIIKQYSQLFTSFIPPRRSVMWKVWYKHLCNKLLEEMSV